RRQFPRWRDARQPRSVCTRPLRRQRQGGPLRRALQKCRFLRGRGRDRGRKGGSWRGFLRGRFGELGQIAARGRGSFAVGFDFDHRPPARFGGGFAALQHGDDAGAEPPFGVFRGQRRRGFDQPFHFVEPAEAAGEGGGEQPGQRTLGIEAARGFERAFRLGFAPFEDESARPVGFDDRAQAVIGGRLGIFGGNGQRDQRRVSALFRQRRIGGHRRQLGAPEGVV